jgi:hypothetical protein
LPTASKAEVSVTVGCPPGLEVEAVMDYLGVCPSIHIHST